ncbi:MAG: hypothetical protein HYZ15_13910 [Sphingobacteriales bacterium]|nr:hypothetical protein [Sphingobacteriales bacterium]
MKFIFLSAFMALGNLVFAQASGTGIGGGGTVQKRMEVYSWAERPEEERVSDVQQLFLEQQWMPGLVEFRSGRPDMQVPLIFDIHNNTLYYLQGKIIMEFVDTVSSFFLTVPHKSDSLTLLYRSGFTAFQANTTETFYQVLVDGKVQLLKCRAKSILLIRDKDLPEEKRTELKELYFACLPGNKLQMLPLNAERIKASMPEYAAKIATILKKEHIKLKNEAKLTELFVHLNNELQ